MVIDFEEAKMLSTPTSARYQPKGIFFVAGLFATHIENKEIINDAKSVNK